jgi:hypothetical protein
MLLKRMQENPPPARALKIERLLPQIERRCPIPTTPKPHSPRHHHRRPTTPPDDFSPTEAIYHEGMARQQIQCRKSRASS